MITWIIVSIIAIATIIIKVLMEKEKSTSNKKIVVYEKSPVAEKPQEKDSHDDKPADSHTHGSHDGDHKSTNTTSVWSDFMLVFSIIIFSMVILFGIILGIRYIEKTKPKAITEYIEKKWVRYDSITVPLYDNFGVIYTLNYSDRFTFEESTEPYCVINSNNYMECGERGQDISKKMGTDNGNKELRFKSNSRRNGWIKLIIWREIEIKRYILN